MAALMRCDECKKLSDDPHTGHIGRSFELNQGRYTVLTMTVVVKDLCAACVKNLFQGNMPSKPRERDDD